MDGCGSENLMGCSQGVSQECTHLRAWVGLEDLFQEGSLIFLWVIKAIGRRPQLPSTGAAL